MRAATRRVFVFACLGAMACAVPVAISPTRGWLVTAAAVLAFAAGLTVHVHRRFVDPVEQLADAVRPYVPAPGASTEDLARMVAFEYRDAVARLDEALAEGRRREVAIEHSSDGVILVDADGLVDHANAAARTMLRRRVFELSRRLTEPQLDALVRRAVSGGSPSDEEITLRIPAARHMLARAVPLRGGGCVLVLHDLSEAYRVDQVRRDFVANVSHELKTPVAGIRALGDVAVAALRDGDDATAARFVDRIQVEGERLSGLVADLLDLSRVEAGQDMQIDLVDVRALVESAAGRVRTAAETKGIEIEIAGAAGALEADPSQLGVAVQNLVDNAVRYSDAGTVRVQIAEQEGWISIEVADDGIGIPTDELPRIFERFYRVDRARSRATGGTGLGLSIVRHVAENHGGRVDVTSERGTGSVFTLRLPSAAGRRGHVA